MKIVAFLPAKGTSERIEEKNLKLLNSKITPYIVKREFSNFNEALLNNNPHNFTSATSIRNCIELNKIDLLKKYVPIDTYNIIKTNKACFNEDLFNILKYKIISSTPKPKQPNWQQLRRKKS